MKIKWIEHEFFVNLRGKNLQFINLSHLTSVFKFG